MPGARGRAVHRRIGIENAAPISIERLPAFFSWQHAQEILAEIGVETWKHIDKCGFQLFAGAEEGRAQHDAADPMRMRLRIGQRQRRAPGAADNDPAFKPKFLADHLHVRDQIRQRVILATAFGAASAGAALIEQHGTKALRIEQPPVVGLAAAAWAAVQIDRGDAIRPADTLDVDLVTVADRQ